LVTVQSLVPVGCGWHLRRARGAGRRGPGL